MNEHAGTHIDAPTHFNADGWDPSEIPLERLVNLPACVIDISSKAAFDPHAQLEVGKFSLLHFCCWLLSSLDLHLCYRMYVAVVNNS